MRTGLTKKRLNDKRFRKNEDKMMRAFLSDMEKINMDKMAKRVGVARSTVYRHHSSIRSILPDYKKYLLRIYRPTMRKMIRKKNIKLEIIFMHVLRFVLLNKKIFKVMVRCDGDEIFRDMIMAIKPKLVSVMGLPKKSERLFSIYASEVARLIYDWGQNDFNADEMGKILGEMTHLTRTARERLGFLLEREK